MAAHRKLTPGQEANVAESYAAGASLAEIKGAFGISSGTIRAVVVRNGVPLRPVGRPKAA